MSDVARMLLVGWVFVVVLGIVYYLTRPERRWIKRINKKKSDASASSGKQQLLH